MSDRASALRYLKTAADTMTLDSFFSLKGKPEKRTWPYLQGTVTLTVNKRQYSEAEPKNVSYEITLGPLLRPRERMVIYVKDPIDDDVQGGLEANRTAYKRCLEKLVENPLSFTEEEKAQVPPLMP